MLVLKKAGVESDLRKILTRHDTPTRGLQEPNGPCAASPLRKLHSTIVAVSQYTSIQGHGLDITLFRLNLPASKKTHGFAPPGSSIRILMSVLASTCC